MSQCYWAIEGFGWKIDWDRIDPVKYATASGCSEEMIEDIKTREFANAKELINHFDWDEYEDFDEISVNTLGEGYTGLFGFSSGREADTGDYFVYHKSYPWQISTVERNFTREDVVKLFAKMLVPILKDDVDPVRVLAELDDISTYGCG